MDGKPVYQELALEPLCAKIQFLRTRAGDRAVVPMTRDAINFDTVRKIALALAGVEESTGYGRPALKVRGKLLACIPANRSAEPGSLVVCVDREDRAELLDAAPDVYYVTDHYVGFDTVLVRLSRVSPDLLNDILRMAHKFVTAKARPSSSSRRPGKRRSGKSI